MGEANLDLASKLRSSTSDAHRRAERAGAMAQLLHGSLPLDAYRQLLVNLRLVYQVLERTLALNLSDPLLQQFGFDELWRVDALDLDLAELGAEGDHTAQALKVTSAYCDHLAGLEHRPALLLAHAYVRYMGDLNGGQTLKRLVLRSYADKVGGATRFYHFGGPENISRLTASFRDALNRIPNHEHVHEAIIAEALASFSFHRILFEELATHAPE